MTKIARDIADLYRNVLEEQPGKFDPTIVVRENYVSYGGFNWDSHSFYDRNPSIISRAKWWFSIRKDGTVDEMEGPCKEIVEAFEDAMQGRPQLHIVNKMHRIYQHVLEFMPEEFSPSLVFQSGSSSFKWAGRGYYDKNPTSLSSSSWWFSIYKNGMVAEAYGREGKELAEALENIISNGPIPKVGGNLHQEYKTANAIAAGAILPHMRVEAVRIAADARVALRREVRHMLTGSRD